MSTIGISWSECLIMPTARSTRAATAWSAPCYMPTEGHIKVPFGGVLQHRWWYKLWATLGIRNEFQGGVFCQPESRCGNELETSGVLL